MIDKLLDIGAGADWMGPLYTLIRGGLSDGYTFGIEYAGCPVTGRDIQLELKRRGIKSWGLMVAEGLLMLSVKKQDAPKAQRIMQGMGVSIENPVAPTTKQPRNAARKAGDPFSVFNIFD